MSRFEGNMTEGLLDRYFRLLAGQLPAAEYGVIADEDEVTDTGADVSEAAVPAEAMRGCLC